MTLRVRYYGLYAWLSRIYAERVRHTGVETWRRTVRRTEALYALTAVRAATHGLVEGGVAGVNWAQRQLESGGDVIQFADHADPDGAGTPYLQQSWGAYGAAYGSQLFEIGILGESALHDIPVPAPPIGDEVADAFAQAAGPLADHFFSLVELGRASLAELDGLAPLLPSAIGEDTAERAAYERLLLAEASDPRESDIARRRSLVLALRVAGLLGRDPSPDNVRWVLYAAADLNKRLLDLGDDADLEAHRLRWWAYQASELGRVACEALLKWLLDALEPYPAGLGAGQLINNAVDALDIPTAGWPASWQGLVLELPDAGSPLSDVERTSEQRLVNLALRSGRGAAAASVESARSAIELLAILHRRCAHRREILSRALGVRPPFRSIVTELAFLDMHQEKPLPDVIRLLFDQRVLQRHLWVAMRKLQYQRDYTFLIDADDNRLRLRAKDGPVFTGPRLGPALTFLRDIHLLGVGGVTDKGKQVAAA